MSTLARVMVFIAMATAATFAYFWDDLVHLYYNKTSKPISVADAYCAHFWVVRAQNDVALECYLTKKTERLCDPAEVTHLAWTFRDYERDRSAFAADLAGALVSVNLGTAAEQAADPKLEGMQAMSKSQEKVGARIKSTGSDKAWKMEVVPKRKLIAEIKELATQGYIQESDFGMWPDSLITKAFNDVTPSSLHCSK